MKHIYTDGACAGNPGPGGWAAVVVVGGKVDSSFHGRNPATTNNQMEMMAAIEGLKQLQPSEQGVMYTDSQYVIKGMTEWLKGWKAKGWKTAAGAPVKNQDLWMQLDALASNRNVTWKWVKGHSGDIFNEMADTLARTESLYYKN